jgi:hypothetical protein
MATNISEWQEEILSDVPKCPAFTIDKMVLKTLRDFCEHTRIWTTQLTVIPLIAYTYNYTLTSSSGDIVEVTHAEIDNTRITPVTERLLDETEPNWRDQTAAVPTRYFMGYDRTMRLVYTPNEDSDVNYALTDLTFAATGDTITTAAGDFVTAGVLAGQILTVSGSTSNNRNFTVTAVTETVITAEGGVTNEGTANASATFTVKGLNVWVALKPLLTATTIEDFIYEDHMETIANGARARLFAMVNQPWANGEYAQYFQTQYLRERDKAANRKRLGLTKANSGGMRA